MTDSKIIEQLNALKRGTVEILSEQDLAAKLDKAQKKGIQLRIKLGLDPTSPDIHLGHTVVLRKMRQFQDMGHKAVLLIGDYTARIGDPTGQNTTRPMLTGPEIEENAKTYFEQASKVLDTSNEKLEVVYNSHWLAKMNLADILQLTSNMTVARMLERDTFDLRYKKGDPIGIHEFLYPLMQGYDSVMIKADVELGGTDQTFNNLIGRDLQRLEDQEPQIVITMPILVGLDGKEKMSKSKNNYIGITDKPSDMFGKVMSISDEMMENYFTLLTDIPVDEIKTLCNPSLTHPKDAKVRLGKYIVEQFYDAGSADQAEAEFQKIFAQGQLPDDMPEIIMPNDPLMAFKLVVTSGLVASGGEAKRMVKQGAVKINENKISDPKQMIKPENDMVIQVGKRKFAKLKLEN